MTIVKSFGSSLDTDEASRGSADTSRPVVSLRPGIIPASGDGSLNDPWVIQE